MPASALLGMSCLRLLEYDDLQAVLQLVVLHADENRHIQAGSRRWWSLVI